MNHTQLSLSVLTASVLAVMSVATAHAETELPNTTLQTITVTADVNNKAINGQEDSVYAQDSVAMQQASHVSDYLNDIPGVDINGTSNIDQGINIRGVRDTDLKITVDGVRQENHFFHHATNLALDSDLFKEAEVSVGNNSVTLGNNARGGAVEFKTVDAQDLLKPDQNMGARVKVGYATNNEELNTVGTVYGKPTENTDVLLSYGVRSADQGEDGDGNPLMTRESDIENILAKFSVTPADGHKVTASFSRYKDEGTYYRGGDKYSVDNLDRYSDEDYEDRENTNDQYSLGYEYTPSDAFNLELKAYHTERAFSIRGSEGGVDGITAKAQSKLTQGEGDNTVNHKFVYGAEAYRTHSTNDFTDRRSGKDIRNKQAADYYGVYVEDQIDMGRFHLTPGVRYDHSKPASNVANQDYNQVSGALATSVDVTDNISVFGSYTQFFNVPPIPETIFNDDGTGIYVGNDLEAETGANAEVGVSASFDNLLSSDDYLTFVAKAFQTDYDNAISLDRRTGYDCATGAVVGGRNSCMRYVNAEEAQVKGYEIATTYGDVNSAMTASFSHSENDQEGAYAIRNPGDTLSVGYNHWLDNGSSIGGRMNYVADKVVESDDGDVTYDGYTIFDVFGSYVPTAMPDLRLDLGVYNISDKQYSSTTNYAYGDTNDNYAMGRNVKVSASYQF